jgi:hypothetical protein
MESELCLPCALCESYTVQKKSLAMDVRCATYRVRLAMDHVEGFVFLN